MTMLFSSLHIEEGTMELIFIRDCTVYLEGAVFAMLETQEEAERIATILLNNLKSKYPN